MESLQIVKKDGLVGQQCRRELVQLRDCFETYVRSKTIVGGPMYQVDDKYARGGVFYNS